MLMIIADGVWWRRALDPDFDPDAMVPIFMDITRHMLRSRPRSVPMPTAGRPPEGGDPMKAKPYHRVRPGGRRQRSGSRPAISCRTNRPKAAPRFAPATAEAKKLFRVAVMRDSVVPHSRKLAACRAAPRPTSASSSTPARTDGVLKEVRVHRGSRREGGRHHRDPVRRGPRGPGGAGAVDRRPNAGPSSRPSAA